MHGVVKPTTSPVAWICLALVSLLRPMGPWAAWLHCDASLTQSSDILGKIHLTGVPWLVRPEELPAC